MTYLPGFLSILHYNISIQQNQRNKKSRKKYKSLPFEL